MPEDWDREVYKQPPTRTPVVQQQPYNPIGLFEKCFYYGVDRPVTYFRGSGGGRGNAVSATDPRGVRGRGLLIPAE